MIKQPAKQTAADRMKWNQQTAAESISRLQEKLEDNLKSFNDGGSVCYGYVGKSPASMSCCSKPLATTPHHEGRYEMR